MQTLAELRHIIHSHWEELRAGYQVSKLGVFGSYARGEQSEASDLDLLVEFAEPVGLKFVHLADRLEELLQVKVDLVTPDAIKANRRQQILADVVDVTA